MRKLTVEEKRKRILEEIIRRKIARDTIFDRIKRNGFKEGSKEERAILKKVARMDTRIQQLKEQVNGLS